MIYDHIVVGGGTAGCVLANRLSAAPARQVLLIEAGADTLPDRVPEDILDSNPARAFFNPTYVWPDLKVHLQALPHNEPAPAPHRRYEQARIMGGGSSINGQLAVRGCPEDYDAWHSQGAAGWNWAGVLPYFRRLEHDLDFAGEIHGKGGPIPIRRIFPESWSRFSLAAAQAYQAAGYPFRPDMNGEFSEGHYPVPFNNAYDRRVSTAVGYLDPMTRRRANLRILTSTRVRRLVVEAGRVAGVEAETGGRVEFFRGCETIIACGAIHSPAMLMRAGIGPAVALKQHGIEVIADSPGVGANLQDHPAISISAYLLRSARLDRAMRRHLHVNARYSSGAEGCPPVDMGLSTIAQSAWHAVGWRLGTLQVFVNRSFSQGRVRLASADWRAEPVVEFNYLSDPRDLVRLMTGFRKMAGLMASAPIAGCVRDPFPSSYSERVRDVGKVTLRNKVLTGILGRLLDGPPSLRRFLVRAVITEGETLAHLLADVAALEAFIRRNVVGVWHAAGTCRMGASDDRCAVTDPVGRVRSIDGLRVVDASLMPAVTRANTNIPTIMIAEKIADAIASRA